MKKFAGLFLFFYLFSISFASAQWLYTDINPPGCTESLVLGVSSTDQVGWTWGPNAARWFSTPSSVSLSSPASRAYASNGTVQIGYINNFAYRWTGSSSS